MYEYPEKCPCSFTAPCRGDRCLCTVYCGHFSGQVALFKSKTYVTISPDPRGISSYDDCHEQIFKLLKKLSKVTHDFIVVLELAGLRPHYHCIFDVKDKVGFNIKLLNYGRYNNCKKHSAFKNGLHYIFKQVDETRSETNIEPIVLHKTITDLYIKKKINVPLTNVPEWLNEM